MVHVQCAICLVSKLITDFRWASCGHGFCEPCITKLFEAAQNRAKTLPCPNCRVRMKRGSLVKIFPEKLSQDGSQQPNEISDDYSSGIVAERTQQVVEKLGTLNENSSLTFVAGLTKDVQRVVDGIEELPFQEILRVIMGKFSLLCGTISDQRRVLHSCKTEIESLKGTIRDRLVVTERLKGDRSRLESLFKDAVSTTEKIKSELDNERKNAEKLAATIKGHKDTIQGHLNTILSHKSKESKQAQKIDALRDQVRNLEEREKGRQGIIPGSSRRRVIASSSKSEASEYGDLEPGDDMSWAPDIESDSEFAMQTIDLDDTGDTPVDLAVPSSLSKYQRPKFSSEWNLNSKGKRTRDVTTRESASQEPARKLFAATLGLDRHGRPVKGALQVVGDRRRF